MNTLPLSPFPLSRPAARPVPHAAAASTTIALARRELLGVAAPHGRLVICVRGRIWLTFEGCRADIVLEAGDIHRCTERGHLLVQALHDAVVQLP